MKWSDPDDQLIVKRLACSMDGDERILTWQWPKGLEYVYIYVYRRGQEQEMDELGESDMRLYSRNEYKNRAGYRERITFIGTQEYRVFPAVLGDDNRLTAIRQWTNDNCISVSGSRCRIEYAIKYMNQLFGKHRKASIKVFCEMPIPKDVLCYVKKEGGVPLSAQDGILYSFPRDFGAGETLLPEIYIKKNEMIRLFFTDGKIHGESYELIQK